MVANSERIEKRWRAVGLWQLGNYTQVELLGGSGWVVISSVAGPGATSAQVVYTIFHDRVVRTYCPKQTTLKRAGRSRPASQAGRWHDGWQTEEPAYPTKPLSLWQNSAAAVSRIEAQTCDASVAQGSSCCFRSRSAPSTLLGFVHV